MSEQAMAPIPCDHHYVSSHEPGHLIYWVCQCSLCHQVSWDDLDAEIRMRDLIRRRDESPLAFMRRALRELWRGRAA